MRKIYLFISMLAAVIIGCEDKTNEFDVLGEAFDDFTLVSPQNNSQIVLNVANPTAEISIKWNAATIGVQKPVTYKFLLDKKGNAFANPIFTKESANSGKDPSVSLTNQELDNALSAAGFTNAQEAELIWTVQGTNGDITKNANTYMLTIKRFGNLGVTNFELLTPENKQTLELNKIMTPNDLISFTWNAATATDGSALKYTLLADKFGGDFSEPVFELNSNNNGADAAFAISHINLINLLKDIFTANEERMLMWTVKAQTADVYSLAKARLVRFDIFDVDSLFVLGDATDAGWDNTKAVPLTKDAEGKFSGIVKLYAVCDTIQHGFKFIKDLGSWEINWGGDGGTATSGNLVSNGDNVAPPTADGSYKIEVDFTTMTYKYEKLLVENLYIVGDATDAGWEVSMAMPFYKMSDTKFAIITYLQAGMGYKFVNQQEWPGGPLDAMDWAYDGTTEGVLYDGAGETNIPVSGESGMYLIEVDFEAMTYTATPANLGIIGDSTPGGWNADTDMTLSVVEGTPNTYRWSVTLVLLAGKQFKFRLNDAWDYAYGLENGEISITPAIPNFNTTDYGVTADGSYTVWFDLEAGTAGQTAHHTITIAPAK